MKCGYLGEINPRLYIKPIVGEETRRNVTGFGHDKFYAQDEDSGHRILRDPAGKIWKSHRIPWESIGNGSSIPAGSFWNFFPVNSYEFPVFSGGKRSKIIGKNPRKFRLEYCFHLPVCFRCIPMECAGNTPDPAGSCRTSLSWAVMML